MTDDILDWLKMWAEYSSVKAAYGDKISRAANEIERLRAENEKLRAALKQFIIAVEFECLAIVGGASDIEKRGQILLDCARDAKATLKGDGDE